MATLVIKDLEENRELDSKAMRTIVGGRRVRLRRDPLSRLLKSVSGAASASGAPPGQKSSK